MEPLKSKAGRNNHGRVTCRHQGGGHKRRYRKIDFKRNKFGIPGSVRAIEYDPNRSARIALIVYPDGEKRYILAPEGLSVGQTVLSGAEALPRSAIIFPSAGFPWERSSTMSNSGPVTADRSPEAPAPAYSSWPGRAGWPPSGCPPVR